MHGRTGLPCPVCGDTVREVSFADKSFQYCPTCQTGGKVLADRRMHGFSSNFGHHSVSFSKPSARVEAFHQMEIASGQVGVSGGVAVGPGQHRPAAQAPDIDRAEVSQLPRPTARSVRPP